MQQNRILTLTIMLTIMLGCDRKFPEAKRLTEYKQTTFLPTLEHKLPENSNSIYCATFLYAWDDMKETLKSPLQFDNSLNDLYLINNSTSHVNTLKDDEYSSNVNITEQFITVGAEFRKSLPFELELTSYDENGLIFDNVKVAAFGSWGPGYKISNIIQILYYKNDNNFIIKIQPKDKDHEIVLYKSEIKFKSMADIVSDIEKKSAIGLREQKIQRSSWKYLFTRVDKIAIPKIEFNIQTDYSTLKGAKFKSKDISYEIDSAWQRTAFILDEKGAEIESESEWSVKKDEEDEEDEPKPKMMIFDKPFFIMLKRIDNRNPYFGLWAMNTELLRKINNE
jgi:hypothetical protein